MPNTVCEHEKRTKTNNVTVCTGCGLVLSQDDFAENVFSSNEERGLLRTELGGTQLVPLKSVSYPNLSLYHLIKSICSLFNIPNSVGELAMSLLECVLAEKIVNRGRSGRRAAISLIYLLARNTTPIPISISDMSQAIGESAIDMFSSISMVKPFVTKALGSSLAITYEPSIFLERHIDTIYRLVPSLGDRREILSLASNFCKLAEENSLVEGRKPEAISLACSMLSLESMNLLPLKVSECKRFLQTVCEKVGISLETATLRLNELKDALITEAKANPLFAEDAHLHKRNKIAIIAADILKHKKLSEAKPQMPPPSFVKSSMAAKDWLAQIERVKQRLNLGDADANIVDKNMNIERVVLEQHASTNTEKAVLERHASTSIEEIILERLLLHNVPMERIEMATNLTRLLSLEAEIFTKDLSDDELVDFV